MYRGPTAYTCLSGEVYVSFRGSHSKRSSPPPRRSLAFTGSCGPTYAFLDLVAEVGIHASYSHPAVRADLIIAPPAEIRSDEVLLLKSLERVVHRVVR